MYDKRRYERRNWRIRAIKECLNEGIKSTKEISEELRVPIRTIRNDLKYIRESKEW